MENVDMSRQQRIENWLVQAVAEELEKPPESIEKEVPLSEMGLDSVSAVALTGELEDWLEQEVDPTLIFDYPTIRALAAHLCSTDAEKNADA